MEPSGSLGSVRGIFISAVLPLLVCGCAPAPRGAAAEIAAYQSAQRAAVENTVSSGVPAGALELEDARRLAQGMIQLSGRILRADPEAPVFESMEDGVTRTGLANPDNDHLLARIRGDRVYRIHGARGETADLSIQTFRTFVGSSQGVDEVGSARLDLDAAGGFEVFVGPGKGDGTRNWLRSDPETRWVLVRRTRDDWREPGGDVSIERVVEAGVAGFAPLSDAERFREASHFLGVNSTFWPGLSRSVLEQLPENRVMPPRRGVGNLAQQWTSMSLFSLADDQALVVTAHVSAAAYQGLQVGSVLFDFFDPFRQTSLSRAQSHVSGDGRIHYVVSARDPGIPNWIDTADHDRGFLLLRWQGLDALEPDAYPTGRVVPFDAVLDVLPPDVPRVDAQSRRDQLAQRRVQLERRKAANLR